MGHSVLVILRPNMVHSVVVSLLGWLVGWVPSFMFFGSRLRCVGLLAIWLVCRLVGVCWFGWSGFGLFGRLVCRVGAWAVWWLGCWVVAWLGWPVGWLSVGVVAVVVVVAACASLRTHTKRRAQCVCVCVEFVGEGSSL